MNIVIHDCNENKIFEYKLGPFFKSELKILNLDLNL